MGVVLMFICPETGREVPVRIMRSGERLNSALRAHEFEFACWECRGTRSWTIGEGRLDQREPPPAPRVARIA